MKPRAARKLQIPRSTLDAAVLQASLERGPNSEAKQYLVKRRRIRSVDYDQTLQGVSAPFTGTPIPVPTGYGRYCSLVYPGGGWALLTSTIDGDPCAQLLKLSPGGAIARAGLWSQTGDNNVLSRCDSMLRLTRGNGFAPIRYVFDRAQGLDNCVFTISPTALGVFGLPYAKTTPTQVDPSDDVILAWPFNHDVYHYPIDVRMFGQTPDADHALANYVDHTGRQRDVYYVDGNANPQHFDGEPAYDIIMPRGKPLVAVADGVVLAARERDVTQYGCTNGPQRELFVYHQVGSGVYAERFVVYYAHESKLSVHSGDKVTRGQVLGEAGTSGCSSGDHLHLGVFRTTNLSGTRSYAFAVTDAGYGINGIQGAIDPWGWAAPAGMDPWPWLMLDQVDPENAEPEPGAHSIALWDGAGPPF
ncbi:MAG TPA: M23 family metallopeptidase [Polyangiaceae bacterium]|nr:M23 family metallopeptidase [Polyangiaceae bacterium]